MASKPRGERSSVREMKLPAALLRSPVSGPPSSQIACTIVSTLAASRMSAVWHFTEPARADRGRDEEGAVKQGVGDGVEAAGGGVFGAGEEVPRGVVEKSGERPAVPPDRLPHRVHACRVADVRGVAFPRTAVLCREI